MAVNPRSLETPERGMELETREEKSAGRKGPAAELLAIQERIKALRTQKPPAAPKIDAYSRDWWAKGWEAGWKAALEAISKD